MPMYNHDVTHCANKECELRNQCYRAWLADNMLAHGWETGWFFKAQKTGNECEYFTNINNY